MTKLLITSDSHGLTEELSTMRSRHQAAYHVHCGDSELVETSPYLEGYKVVKGNCDWQSDFPDELLLTIDGLRIFITHGHLFNVKQSLMTLQYRAMELEADIVCFGHSHIAYAEKMGEILFLNPGSIRLPKKFPKPSYLILQWKDKTKITVQFYDMQGQQILTFPYETQFSL